MMMNNVYVVEAFDLVQLLFTKDHDHQMHGVIKLNGHINENILKKAIIESVEDLPHIICKLEKRLGKEHWRRTNCSIEDLVKITHCDLSREEIMKVVTMATDTYNGPQLCVTVLRDKNDDVLCIVMNHMLCDGVGFKNYLYLLCSLYNNIISGKHVEQRYNANARSLDKVYKKMKGKIENKKSTSIEDKTIIKVLLEGDETRPFILTEKISRENFLLMKDYAKKHKVTINDIFMTAYIIALRNSFNLPISKMKCTVDIRKYLDGKKLEGLSNFTSFLECNIDSDKLEFSDALNQVSLSMKEEKESTACLKLIIYLHRAYKYLPYPIFKKAISIFLRNPPIAFTNIGILEKNLLEFEGVFVKDAFVTGSIKHVPNFQLAVSTFNDEVTLSINLYGSTADEEKIYYLLKEVKLQLMEQIR